MRSLKIAIATTGRFHVLDLARELSALGHEVVFYSLVPRRRAMRFGLPGRCHRALLVWVAPWLVAQRLAAAGQRGAWARRLLQRTDALIARRLEPCDVFIGMSGLCVESANVAKREYGARVFIERGSRHILSQKQILDDLAAIVPKADTVPLYAVERELASYELADVVVVPSQHVEHSFLERGFRKEHLFRNPYGVDLRMFQPTPVPPLARPVVLYVGTWSIQKGCDLLLGAVKRCGESASLLHVGSLGDAPLPRDRAFSHEGPVPQWRLPRIYARAHVFVLASRQDGLGLVLGQALACGLPVVCTDRTGGEDLRDMLPDPTWVVVVSHDSIAELSQGIGAALERASTQEGMRDILGAATRRRFSWKAYGERYAVRLEGL